MRNGGRAWIRSIGLGFDVCIASLEKHKTKDDRPITSEEVNMSSERRTSRCTRAEGFFQASKRCISLCLVAELSCSSSHHHRSTRAVWWKGALFSGLCDTFLSGHGDDAKWRPCCPAETHPPVATRFINMYVPDGGKQTPSTHANTYLSLESSKPNSLLCHPSWYVRRLLESRRSVVVNQTRSFDTRLIRASRHVGSG
jgi:hypothetical protein